MSTSSSTSGTNLRVVADCSDRNHLVSVFKFILYRRALPTKSTNKSHLPLKI